MRIGVDARLMHHQPAGISRYTWHLLQALANLNREDEFIVFQHRRHQTPLITQANFRRGTLYSPVHRPLEQWLLPLELLRFPLDLLHSTDFIPPLHSPIPAVITVHDLAFLHWPHFITKASAAYYGQIDRAVRHARHIIVPSENTKQDLIGQLGVLDHKVSVIHEAADPTFQPLPLEATRQEVMKKYDLPASYILFVSTIEPRKNVSGLLAAFHHLRQRYNLTDTALVFAGSRGWLYEENLEMVRKLNLEQATCFLGRVPDPDLQKLYVAARCHVHPAHYEGFGLPPLEAMACGTPTIVSNSSSLPEVVGDAALLVDPNDPEEIAVAMQRLLVDDQLHAELRAKGLQRAKCFSWESAARSTMDVYRKVAHVPAPTAPTMTPASSKTTSRL
jgi:glycosyltransferase involved in cell wall biosynthesis